MIFQRVLMNRTRQLRKVNSLVNVKLLSNLLAFTKDKIKKGKVYFIIVKISKLPRIPGQSSTDSLGKTTIQGPIPEPCGDRLQSSSQLRH